MLVLSVLREFANQCSRLLSTAARLQTPARTQLVADLSGICDRCETAYGVVLQRLGPVEKTAYHNRLALVDAIRAFVGDTEVRANFKPSQLCGDAAILLDRLSNNLDSLKYSIDIRKISEVKATLTQFDNYDLAFYRSFDDFAMELDGIATNLADPSLSERDVLERMSYVRSVIDDFQDDLAETVRAVQNAKQRLR